MPKARFLSAAFLVVALALFLIIPAAAQCDPMVDESCRLSPLQSRQVNPAAQSSEGSSAELEASGAPAPVQVSDLPLVSADSLSLNASPGASSEPRAQSSELSAQGSELNSSSNESRAPSIDSLDLRMRYQDPSDVSCGVQALGMALDGLAGDGLEAPASSALLGFLENKNMMYDFGTGVEELAYAAGSFGFKGSQPFHGWSMDQLTGELIEDRPVVVALGSNGEGQPGHFVTLTGISADGQWISYNDPTLGKVTSSVAEFEALWAAQGKSGVSVRSPSSLPAGTPDNLPLLAFATGTLALASLGTLGRKRQGVGGGLTASASPAPPSGTGDPDTGNYVTLRVPYEETVVVGQKVIDQQLVEKQRWVPTKRIVVREGYYKTETVQEAYTAYRPRVRLVEKTVNVVKTVWDKVTTWVSKKVVKPVTEWVRKTITKPVTKWIRRTSSWFERTWFGRWVRRVRTWYQKVTRWVSKTIVKPVTRWVTKTIVEPVTSWVKRTIVEPVTEWVEEIYYEPYTAYRDKTTSTWIKPEVDVIPGHMETYEDWEDVTIPIEEQITRWRDQLVNIDDLPSSVAQDFFNRIDPSLSLSQQLGLFYRFRNAMALFPPGSSQAIYDEALSIFFGGFTGDGQTAPASLTNGYGTGPYSWKDYWANPERQPGGAQYLNLADINLFGPASTYPVHKNLCGQLAAIAALGLDLKTGLELFEQLQTSRPVFNEETGEYEGSEPVTGAQILSEWDEGTYGHQLVQYLESAGAGEYSYETGSYGKPPASQQEIAGMVQSGDRPLALVTIDKGNGGQLGGQDDSDQPVAHWVSILGITPTQDGGSVVRVYNPYQNQEEYYSWETFNASWSSTPKNSSQYGLVTEEHDDQ